MTTKEGKKPAKLVIVVIYLCCLSLLLGLGAWQLMRGLEKAGLERVLKDQVGQEKSFDRKPGNWNQYRYSPVALTGRYLPGRYFLLDNRIYKGQLGYEILSPFVLSHDHGIVLVNRGWIPKTRNPEPLSETVDSGNDVTVSGQLYIPEKGFTLGPAYTETGKWPVVVQYIDQDAMSTLLEQKLEKAMVVTDGDSDLGLVKLWQPYIINATRHYGYAVQWWGLSIVFIIFGLIWRRMGNRQPNQSQPH
jgi:surfeit locus 1 family protein